jgi:hypothetical protein
MSSKMLSLYDYLGRPAGKALGWAVAKQASAVGARVETRYVENPAYKGNVNLYNEEVLKIFFNNPTNKAIINADEKAYYEMKARRAIWVK